MRTEKYLKRMGYSRDQDGIVHRYEREAGGWDRHLMECRQHILDYVDALKPESMAILGSGWLLDVPLEEILTRGVHVVLVDIVQPPQIRHRLRREKSVRVLQADLTGGLARAVFQAAKRNKKGQLALPSPDLFSYKPDYQVDVFVSLNLLTQLDSLIVEYLLRQSRWSPDELDSYREAIQQQHLSFLKNQNALLITEYAEVRTTGGKKEQRPLVYTLPEAKYKIGIWTWDFDTGGNYYRGSDTCFHVGAYKFERCE